MNQFDSIRHTCRKYASSKVVAIDANRRHTYRLGEQCPHKSDRGNKRRKLMRAEEGLRLNVCLLPTHLITSSEQRYQTWNDFIRPVLKHGPRSLPSRRVLRWWKPRSVMKVMMRKGIVLQAHARTACCFADALLTDCEENSQVEGAWRGKKTSSALHFSRSICVEFSMLGPESWWSIHVLSEVVGNNDGGLKRY